MLKFLQPQLATLAETVPTSNEWLHETKWDGYRLIAEKEKQSVRLLTRNGLDWTNKFSIITKEMKAMHHIGELILDGELVVLDKNGISNFQSLQDSIPDNNRSRYYVFDILLYDGQDLRNKPLYERKKILDILFKKWKRPHPHILNTDYIQGNGETVFKAACQHKLEGIISKKIDSPYESRRTKTWLKNKCTHRQEFVIGGFTTPAGSRSYFGALLLGYYNTKKQFIYAGKLGTGFNHNTLKNLYDLLLAIKNNQSAFYNIQQIVPNWELKRVSWVQPKYVCEVEFTEWTKDGCLRHPAFKGLRMDKSAKDVKKEDPYIQSRRVYNEKKQAVKKAGLREDKSSSSTLLSHPDKKLSLIGISKRELAAYYELVCDSMLTYSKNRPLLLLRCPTGQKTCFYQKHHVKAFPPSIHPILIPNDSNPYCFIDNLNGILSLIQFNTLEIHVWNSAIKHLSKPDKIIFDLDPGPGIDWENIKQAAFIVYDEITQLKLKAFVKLSGKKGLHIIIPFKPKYEYHDVKNFSKTIAQYLTRKYPNLFTDTVSKSKRHNKIFIDYLRNGEGATTVAAYSTRAIPNAPISLPVSWQSLKNIQSPSAYTVKDLLNDKQILVRSNLAWKDFYTCKQSLSKNMLKKLLDR